MTAVVQGLQGCRLPDGRKGCHVVVPSSEIMARSGC